MLRSRSFHFAPLTLCCAALTGCGGSGGPGLQAPTALSYPAPSLRAPTGVHLPELAPTVAGGAPTDFSIAPALPSGLALDAEGVVRGIPEGPLAETLYTVTASNAKGSVSAELRLEIDASFDVPRFLYVSNYDDHTLSTFVVTPTGDLRHHAYTAADPNPSALAGAPNGHHIYSAHSADGRISVFRADPATGALERVDEVDAFAGTLDLVLDARGEWLFAAHTAGLATFQAGGMDTLELAANLPAAEPVGLALHPDGATLYAALFDAAAIGVYRIDADTGELTELETEGAGLEPAAVLVHPNGETLYAAHSGAGQIGVYAIDPADGYLELVQTVAAGTQPVDLLLDADGTTLFATDLGGERLMKYSVAGFDGTLTPAEILPTSDAPFALEIDATGEGLYMTHLDTSDVGHWLEPGGGLEEQNRVRTRGGATDALLLSGPTPLSFESSLAFTTNQDFGDVSSLTLDAETGALTDVGQPIFAGVDPLALSFDPTRGLLFAATEAGDLLPFTIDSDTLADAATPGLASGNVTALAVDPTGRFVFTVGAGGLESFSIGADGALTASESLPTGSDPTQIVAEPGGLYLYVLNEGSQDVSGYWVHGVTGRLEELDDSPWDVPAGADAVALAVHPNGRFLYGADEAGDSVFGYAIGVEGDLTPHLDDGVVQAPSHVALSPDGRWLFGTSFTRSEVTLCEVDRLSGHLTTRAVEDGLTGPSSIHVDATGRFAYVSDSLADQVSVFSFDAALGELDKVQDVSLGAGAAPSAVVTNWQLVEAQ